MSDGLLIIGGGNMGLAIAKGLMASGLYSPDNVSIVETNTQRQEFLHQNFSFACYGSLAEAPVASTFLLAIKPQTLTEVLSDLVAHHDYPALCISIVAGARLARLEKALPKARIVRVMPNTPCQVSAGMSLYTSNQAKAEDLNFVQKMLGVLGVCIEEQEEKLDAATALCGSGPGFIFYLANQFYQTALRFGFTSEKANTIVRQTFFGAGKMMISNPDKPLTQLQSEVTSPQGSTYSGILELEKGSVCASIDSALEKACQRSIELGKDR